MSARFKTVSETWNSLKKPFRKKKSSTAVSISQVSSPHPAKYTETFLTKSISTSAALSKMPRKNRPAKHWQNTSPTAAPSANMWTISTKKYGAKRWSISSSMPAAVLFVSTAGKQAKMSILHCSSPIWQKRRWL